MSYYSRTRNNTFDLNKGYVLEYPSSKNNTIPVFKRGLDIILLVLSSVFVLPVIIFIAAMQLLLSGKDIFFIHERIGKDGKKFKLYKFRTMKQDADLDLKNLLDNDEQLEKEWNESYKLKTDPRVTTFGKFLRKYSLDELPQLLNILKGQMSFVGPRPIVEGEIPKYGKSFAAYSGTVPGITGLWQINGRSDTKYDQRIDFDVYYTKNWSIFLDLYILFKTPFVIFKRKGAY